jgi:hypothetical protein
MPKSLEQSIQLHRNWAIQAIDAASDWRLKKNRGRELFCLGDALQNSLCVAVLQYDTPQSGIEYLKTEFKSIIFDHTLELIRELHIKASDPQDDIGALGVFKLALTVHAAWLLDLFAEAEELTSIYTDERQKRFYQSGTLWGDYVHGLAAVAHGKQFTQRQKKYKGYERHWAVYLQLMADICAGNNLSSAITEVDQSFSQRNRDKRLTNEGLDGDGTFPVKWDFRKHSLLLAAEHNTINAA